MRFGGRGRGITIVVGLLWYGLWTVAGDRARDCRGGESDRRAASLQSYRSDCSAFSPTGS